MGPGLRYFCDEELLLSGSVPELRGGTTVVRPSSVRDPQRRNAPSSGGIPSLVYISLPRGPRGARWPLVLCSSANRRALAAAPGKLEARRFQPLRRGNLSRPRNTCGQALSSARVMEQALIGTEAERCLADLAGLAALRLGSAAKAFSEVFSASGLERRLLGPGAPSRLLLLSTSNGATLSLRLEDGAPVCVRLEGRAAREGLGLSRLGPLPTYRKRIPSWGSKVTPW